MLPITCFPTILIFDSPSLSTKSLRKSSGSIATIIDKGSHESLNSLNSLCSMSKIPESRGVIFRAGSTQDFDGSTIKRRSFGGSLVRRGSLKLSKSVASDDLVIERSNTVLSEDSFVSCLDDDTPVNSDNESNEFDEKKHRKSILDQMSVPQVLKDQGITSLSNKVSLWLNNSITPTWLRIFRMRRTRTDRAGPALTSGRPCQTM